MKVRVFRGMILWASDVQWALKSISLTFSNVSLFSAKVNPRSHTARTARRDVTPNKSHPQSFLTR